MSKKLPLDKLNKVIEEERQNDTTQFFRNSFAIACYLAKIGEDEAADKQLATLFDWLGWDQHKVYYSGIRESLKEHAAEYAREIQPNGEILNLFRDRH